MSHLWLQGIHPCITMKERYAMTENMKKLLEIVSASNELASKIGGMGK